MIIAFIIPFFIWINASSASPLGTLIEVCITCAETGAFVPDGLAVTLTGKTVTYGPVTLYTKDGCVSFGSGVEDGNYQVEWYWNTQFGKEVAINCSKIIWHFDFTVPNPVIVKYFEYEGLGTPIEGLDVDLILFELLPEAIPATVIASGTTDASGMVTFGGLYVEVCVEYKLRYFWGGVEYRTDVIHFAYDANGDLQVCYWEETNYLEPKSGGGKQSILG